MDYFEMEAILEGLEEGSTEYKEISKRMNEILDTNEAALKGQLQQQWDEEEEDEE